MLLIVIAISLLVTFITASPLSIVHYKEPPTRDVPTPHVRRDDSQTSPSTFTHTLNLGDTAFGAREILLNTSSGMTLTCVGCSMQGELTLNLDMALNSVAVNGFLSAAASAATSAVGGVLGHLAPRDDTPQTLEALLQNVVGNVSAELTQNVPIQGLFGLEFASGNQDIQIPLFPDPLEGITSGFSLGPSLTDSPLQTSKLGPFDFSFGIQPFAISLSANFSPGINVTLPVAANLTFEDSLELSVLGGASGNIDEPSVYFVPPILNSINPQFCITLVVGPSAIVSLSHAPSRTNITFGVQVELPKISVCFNNQTNVDSSCNPNGPIANALQVKTSLAAGLAINDAFSVLGHDLPGLKKVNAELPNLVRNFDLSDNCLDLSKLSLGANGLQQLPLSLFTVSSSSIMMTNTMSAMAMQETVSASIMTETISVSMSSCISMATSTSAPGTQEMTVTTETATTTMMATTEIVSTVTSMSSLQYIPMSMDTTTSTMAAAEVVYSVESMASLHYKPTSVVCTTATVAALETMSSLDSTTSHYYTPIDMASTKVMTSVEATSQPSTIAIDFVEGSSVSGPAEGEIINAVLEAAGELDMRV